MKLSIDPHIEHGGTYPCFVCGKETKQGSIWRGATGEIALCTPCAWRPQALAVLLADAVADGLAPNVGAYLDNFTTQFWRALALAYLHDVNKWRRREMFSFLGRPVIKT
jgi:hypothetical protein